MKTKITLLLIALVFAFNGYSQQDEECMNNLSIFSSYAKNKKYDEAYEPWMTVRNKCPKFNRNIYVAGAKILAHKIKNSSGAEQTGFVKDLILIHEKHNEYYASKFPTGRMYYEIGNLSYTHRKALGLSDEELYAIFDKGFTEDLNNFKHPKALYTYFSLKVDLYDKGAKTTKDAQDLFDKFDDVNDKIEQEISKNTLSLNKLLKKEEAGEELTRREQSIVKSNKSYLQNYDNISGSMNTKIGNRANCEVLIPLYQKDFEENKNDAKWLQRAMNKMGQKECTDDPMFEQLVAQKNNLEPDANTSYYLGLLNEKKGNTSEAEKYYSQAESLETDPLKKWGYVFKRAEKARKKGSYGKARQLYREALKLNPSNGTPYLRIAAMYAKSAKNCGDTNFNKRAVYWLAASEARKAGKVDGRLKKASSQTVASYTALAPDKSMIFTEGNGGKSIRIGCWIGASVTVPKN